MLSADSSGPLGAPDAPVLDVPAAMMFKGKNDGPFFADEKTMNKLFHIIYKTTLTTIKNGTGSPFWG